MAKYLKKFENHSAYEAAKNGLILPNVSICTTEGDVHYNPYVELETRVVVKYNVTNISSPTPIGYNQYISGFSAIEIDGVEMSPRTGYTFSTTGEHTVKYTLADPTSIGTYTFYYCHSLTSIDIPNSVTSIGGYAFEGCISLTSIDIPSSVTSIGDYTFSQCSGLTSIDIPNSVTSIGNGAFINCTRLASIVIPSGVTSIGSRNFTYCTSLTSMTVDSNNTVYDSRSNCNAIIETSTNKLLFGCQNTTIPNSVTSIGNYAFERCTSLTSIDIPNSVTSIGESAFRYCSGLTSCTIGNGVTSIGIYAFSDCSSLTSIAIPYGVTSIGGSAFDGCSSLTSCTIGNGVTSIGIGAFTNCIGLTSITSNRTTAPTIQSSTFRNVKTGGTLTVPSGSSGYDTWMQNANYYLGLYGWTKVEQ